MTTLVGTVGYIAPEQKTFGSRIGPWTDIYLLARTLAARMGARTTQKGTVELPRDISSEPAGSAIRQALSPLPRDRPADAQKFGRALSEALSSIA